MVTIRKMRKTDLEALYELLSDPRVMAFLEPPYTKEKTAQFLGSAGLSDPPLIYSAEDGKGNFIGYVIYHDYDAGSKEIGWVLKKDAWGNGYAKELTKQLVARAASEGKSVMIECLPDQAATKHIAGLFGFVYTGRRNGLDVYKLEVKQDT